MTRARFLALAVALLLPFARPARAQVDFDALRTGSAGCPELAADPNVGDLAAFLCRPLQRSILDRPITSTGKLEEVRAGAFAIGQRYGLLALSRGDLGETSFTSLQSLLLAGSVLTATQENLRRAWLAEAASPATPPAVAAALIAQANALVAGKFDASTQLLLAARVDRDRLADLRNGLFASTLPVDVVSAFAGGVAGDLTGVATLNGLPAVFDADGAPLVSSASALTRAFPRFVGPDGAGNTADDLPFLRSNPAATAAGYVLGSPIPGTSQDRFDATSGGLAVFSLSAQRTVPSVSSPGTNKLVEVFGIYNPAFIVRVGCNLLGDVFTQATGTCDNAGSNVTSARFVRGCSLRATQIAASTFGVGLNAEGDCVELNSSSTGAARVQFEVLGLLGDPVLRPAQAHLEPVDLTDFSTRLTAPPARPPSALGNVAFPAPAGAFARRVDAVSGAPLGATGTSCLVRLGAGSVPVGPNGVAGDGDDVFPTSGSCLLWGAPDGLGEQHLASASTVGASHSVNQALFHSLCSTSFDADSGRCALDELGDPRTLGATSLALGGLGSSAGSLLDGLETIRTSSTGLAQRLPDFAKATAFLAVNPLGNLTPTGQDLGAVLRTEQSGLLGCGPAFGSPCTSTQTTAWLNDPAILASLGRIPSGGIDLENAVGGVVVQEFAVEKVTRANALVGTALNGVSAPVYLPGINYSRDGTLVNGIEVGAYLPLTAASVLAMSDAARASYQHGAPGKIQADGWVEPMPWAIDPTALSTFGAIVFRADPLDPIAGSGNVFNAVPGEYCGRWMNPSEPNVATPFNQTCTALETISANLERLLITRAVVGQDKLFDPPESLAELVAMLDADRANDATGDPLAGPDGIFGRNAFVFDAATMDFLVVQGSDLVQLATVTVVPPTGDPAAFFTSYNPATCANVYCMLAAPSGFPLPATNPLIAWPISADVDLAPPSVGTTRVNLALLSRDRRFDFGRLLGGEAITVGALSVRMSLSQRQALLGQPGSQFARGLDLDGDGVTDLDRDRDGVWDGLDDFTPGPISDDQVLCGSGIPGDLLQDGLRYEPARASEAIGTPAFTAALPIGLAPRSPVFCRELNALLALTGPGAGGGDAFLWHGGSAGAGSDDDADGFPDALDNCPALANATQLDGDADGVGDACDNCTAVANPRVAAGFVAANAWATLTGGQRDDDHDGFGNKCDADFTTAGALVGSADLTQFRASNGRSRAVDTCGTTHTRPCAIFDLDEASLLVGSPDLNRFRQFNGKAAGPKCTTCPLVCEAGTQGSCN